jgi:protoheme IX farnesyltransferase
MFHGSLLYLPALMAGLILHRLPNEQKEQNIHQTSEMAGVLHGSELQDEERARQKREDQKKHSRVQSRPPVAYASVAPFPFLPVPVYVSTQGHELWKPSPSSQAVIWAMAMRSYLSVFLFVCYQEFLFVC